MAERKRSHDKHRETEDLFGPKGAIDQTGRGGGALAKEIASRDEKKRAKERPAGATRVTKSDERDGDA